MKSISLDNNPDIPWEFFNQANKRKHHILQFVHHWADIYPLCNQQSHRERIVRSQVRLLLLHSGTLGILYIGSCGHTDMFSMTDSASSVLIRASPRPPIQCTRFTRNAISDQNFAIQGRNLSYSITSKNGKFIPILQDCSISIPPGQLWMLLGPNGCGKSTLLKVLAGLLSPTHGTACVKRPKSFVFQNPDHQVVMPTVEADVAFGIGKLNLTEDEVRSRVTKALDAVGMSNYLQRPVQTLSGGQKQRVAIAGALAATCKVLLLDELTTFLDANDQFGVIKAVKNCMVADGNGEVTALWVTHRLEEVEFADGAIYMENGRVIMHDCNASNVMAFVQQRMTQYSQHINS